MGLDRLGNSGQVIIEIPHSFDKEIYPSYWKAHGIARTIIRNMRCWFLCQY